MIWSTRMLIYVLCEATVQEYIVLSILIAK